MHPPPTGRFCNAHPGGLMNKGRAATRGPATPAYVTRVNEREGAATQRPTMKLVLHFFFRVATIAACATCLTHLESREEQVQEGALGKRKGTDPKTGPLIRD